MVSLQPITQSYLDEPQSCFKGVLLKTYSKGSVMDVLVRESPLYAYIAQVARIDDFLDSDFQGTCFAPCKEYCSRYWMRFKGNIDHLEARRFILSSCLKAKMSEEQLSSDAVSYPTLNQYATLQIQFQPCGILLNEQLSIVKADQQCTNGVIHFVNGLVETYLF